MTHPHRQISAETLKKIERAQSGTARAALLGISDGLVTNVSLILGVAAAGASAEIVRIAGIASLIAALLPHVLIQEGKHIGLPNAHAEEREIVPVIRCAADWRVNLQAVRSAKLNKAPIKFLARVDRIVVRGMDEEDRCPDMLNCVEQPLLQLWRSVPAVASAGKKHKRPKIRFPLGL